MIHIPRIWSGEESGLQEFLRLAYSDSQPSGDWLADRHRALSDRGKLFVEDEDEKDLSLEESMAEELIERYDSVGVISVNGHLINDESPILKWFGAVGYPTIARAVNRLLDDEEISSILFSISSGGGEADGVADLGDSILEAGKAKPVYAWTGSNALSAAYWIASSAGKTYSTKMGRTGSIGAVATLRVIHRMLKEAGIDVHIARSAPKKALPSPYEPLTKAGEEQLKKKVDTLHGFFVEYISSRRPALSVANSGGWASGETFFGEEALAIGLVDSPLRSINDLISELNAAHDRELDGDSTMPKHVVLRSEEDRIRMAAGYVSPNSTDSVEISAAADEGGAVPGPEHSADDGGTSGPEHSADDGGSPVLQPSETVVQGADNGVVAFLQERERDLRQENAELRETHTQLRAELTAANARNEQLELLQEPMQRAIERLQVALGHRPSPLEGLPPEVLASMYEDLYKELMGLPLGRQSIPADVATDDRSQRTEDGSEVSPLVASRLSIVPNK